MLANHAILDEADWQIEPQDKIALVGRNGAGKSTLLKLLQGDIVQDKGQIEKRSGLRISGLMQEVPLAENETVYHFLVNGLGDLGELLSKYHRATINHDVDALSILQQQIDHQNAWEYLTRVDIMASHLGLDPSVAMSALSGGKKRLAMLGSALIAEPDLLLLDEPTNHLDINAIEWLESYLKNYKGSLLVVTHDRDFLAAVATKIVEIDRGHLYVHRSNYETYLDRREAIRQAQQKENDLFDKRLIDEEAWIRTGVKARRTRNEGRVRALEAMRKAHLARRKQMGHVKGIALDVARSGTLVLEAKNVNYKIDDKVLVKDFSFLLTRGDKVGIIGPNGCGKTTLVRLLLGELIPDSGDIRRGTGIEIAYFDQLRCQLDERKTVMQNVADGADYVTIQGKQKHVASYLGDFLFASERFNQPVSVLSGGERNRLLLAKLFARPVNVLVMDEPTNDLDIETLEMLETMLVSYPGTLLLISHDRAFIDQVVTSVLVYEHDGHFNEYVGGYEDYQTQKKQQRSVEKGVSIVRKKEVSAKLSFNEQRELSKLPEKIEQLEQDIHKMHDQMADPDFYQQDAALLVSFNQTVLQKEQDLQSLYARWELLEGRK
jgi:ATP-binding cassette subfamily F protein uup